MPNKTTAHQNLQNTTKVVLLALLAALAMAYMSGCAPVAKGYKGGPCYMNRGYAGYR